MVASLPRCSPESPGYGRPGVWGKGESGSMPCLGFLGPESLGLASWLQGDLMIFLRFSTVLRNRIPWRILTPLPRHVSSACVVLSCVLA